MRFLLIILLGLAVATAAKSDGILNPTMQSIGAYDGINNFTTSGGGGCPNSLDFTQACNSQYIGVI